MWKAVALFPVLSIAAMANSFTLTCNGEPVDTVYGCPNLMVFASGPSFSGVGSTSVSMSMSISAVNHVLGTGYSSIAASGEIDLMTGGPVRMGEIKITYRSDSENDAGAGGNVFGSVAGVFGLALSAVGRRAL